MYSLSRSLSSKFFFAFFIIHGKDWSNKGGLLDFNLFPYNPIVFFSMKLFQIYEVVRIFIWCIFNPKCDHGCWLLIKTRYGLKIGTFRLKKLGWFLFNDNQDFALALVLVLGSTGMGLLKIGCVGIRTFKKWKFSTKNRFCIFVMWQW